MQSMELLLFFLLKARAVDRINVVSYETEHPTIGVRDFWLIKEAKATFSWVKINIVCMEITHSQCRMANYENFPRQDWQTHNNLKSLVS